MVPSSRAIPLTNKLLVEKALSFANYSDTNMDAITKLFFTLLAVEDRLDLLLRKRNCNRTCIILCTRKTVIIHHVILYGMNGCRILSVASKAV